MKIKRPILPVMLISLIVAAWYSARAANAPAIATSDEASPVQWDPQGADEMVAALHHLHDVWNTGDIKSLKKLLVGDDVLVTFELDSDTHAPIKLAGREALFKFVDQISDGATANNETFELGHPLVKARVTHNLGICTEECFIKVKRSNGIEERYNLWSTAVAARYPDGWKWLQWHMSTAGPVSIYKDGKLIWQGHKDEIPPGMLSGAVSASAGSPAR